MDAIDTHAPDVRATDDPDDIDRTDHGNVYDAQPNPTVSALIAIEEDRLRASLAAFLRAEGLSPDEAETLSAAQQLLKRSNYGVVFAADRLDGLASAETVTQLRSDWGGVHARLVAVSRDRQPDLRALAAAGFDHVLSPSSSADEIAAQYLAVRQRAFIPALARESERATESEAQPEPAQPASTADARIAAEAIEALEVEIARLHAENTGLQAHLLSTITHAEELEADVNARDTELHDLHERVLTVGLAVTERDERLRQVEEQIGEQENRLRAADARLAELQSEPPTDALPADVRDATDVTDRRRVDLEATAEAEARLEDERIALAQARQELDEQTASLVDQRAALNEEWIALAEERTVLDALRADLEAATVARENAVADLERQHESLHRERDELDARARQIAVISVEFAELRTELAEARGLLSAARAAPELEPLTPEAETRQRRYLETLRTLTFYLARGNSPDRQVQHALNAITALIPSAKIAIWLCGEDGIRLARSSGLHPRYADLAQPMFQAMADEPDVLGQPRFFHEAQSAERPLGELAVHEGFNLAVHIPLVNAEGMTGALAAYVAQPESIGDDELAVLHTVGDTLAATLARSSTPETTPPAEPFEAFNIELLPEAAFICDASGRLLRGNARFAELLGVAADALPDRTLHGMLWSDDAERVVGALDCHQAAEHEDSAASAGLDPFLLDMHRPDGDVIYVDLSLSRLPVSAEDDERTTFLGLVHDTRAIEQDRRERTTMLEIVRLTGSQSTSQHLDELLQSVIEVLARQRGYERVAIWMASDDGRQVVPRATIGMDDIAPVEAGEGIAGSVARDRRTLFVPDSAAEPPLRSAPEVTSALGVPLIDAGRLAGVLTVETTGQRTLDVRDEELLTVVAAHLAGTLGRLETQRQLTRQSSTDPLTGLANRQAFQNELDLAVAHNRRERISVLIVGVDAFKGINEIYGHDTADAILRQIAQLLRARLREEFLLARYNSDQFAILLPGVNRDEAVNIAEHLRIAIAMQLFTAAEQVEQLTISIGAATRPDDASTAQGLSQAADHAMYLAKRAGRNQTFQSNAAFATLAPTHGRLNDMLRQSPRETLALLIRAMDQRLPERAGHSERVTRYALVIGREMGVSEEEIPLLRLAAYIHDIGMVSLPDSLLRKPSTLSAQERELLRGVPVAAHGLLAQLDLPESIPLAVLHQRESYDGSGYPDGLSGDGIPLGARIIAVADALDAMTSARAHREPMSMEQAHQQVAERSGTQFDPAVAQAARVLTGVVAAPVAAPSPVTTELIEVDDTGEVAGSTARSLVDAELDAQMLDLAGFTTAIGDQEVEAVDTFDNEDPSAS